LTSAIAHNWAFVDGCSSHLHAIAVPGRYERDLVVVEQLAMVVTMVSAMPENGRHRHKHIEKQDLAATV